MSSYISRKRKPLSAKIAFTVISLSLVASPAFSQRDYNPNFNHFYMGRQEWTVEDNSPVIINKTGTANGGLSGSMPGCPPLPKAGWQGYAPVENPPPRQTSSPSSAGSKPRNAASSKSGKKGYTGTLGNKAPSGINGYKPYATYSNPTNAPTAGVDASTSTHVKGDLLHWARRSAKQQQ